jgi:hypothetical protein
MPSSLRLAFLLFILCESFSWGQDMAAKECGSCHETQFQTWQQAKHFKMGVVCGVCHGEFHSGTLSGCTGCHTGKHNLEFRNWQFVRDYMVEGDTSDYYCIVCHDPHNPKKAKILLCNTCHGSTAKEPQPRKSVRMSLQSAHNLFADIAPRMDEATWNRRIKSRSGKIQLGAGVIVIGALLLFPYVFTGVVGIRWIRRKWRERRNRREIPKNVDK